MVATNILLAIAAATSLTLSPSVQAQPAFKSARRCAGIDIQVNAGSPLATNHPVGCEFMCSTSSVTQTKPGCNSLTWCMWDATATKCVYDDFETKRSELVAHATSTYSISDFQIQSLEIAATAAHCTSATRPNEKCVPEPENLVYLGIVSTGDVSVESNSSRLCDYYPDTNEGCRAFKNYCEFPLAQWWLDREAMPPREAYEHVCTHKGEEGTCFFDDSIAHKNWHMTGVEPTRTNPACLPNSAKPFSLTSYCNCGVGSCNVESILGVPLLGCPVVNSCECVADPPSSAPITCNFIPFVPNKSAFDIPDLGSLRSFVSALSSNGSSGAYYASGPACTPEEPIISVDADARTVAIKFGHSYNKASSSQFVFPVLEKKADAVVTIERLFYADGGVEPQCEIPTHALFGSVGDTVLNLECPIGKRDYEKVCVDSTFSVQDLSILSETVKFDNAVRLGRVRVGNQACPSGNTANECSFAQVVLPAIPLSESTPNDNVVTSFQASFYQSTIISPQVFDGSGVSRSTNEGEKADVDGRVSIGYVDANVTLTMSDFLIDSNSTCTGGCEDWVSEDGTVHVQVEQSINGPETKITVPILDIVQATELNFMLTSQRLVRQSDAVGQSDPSLGLTDDSSEPVELKFAVHFDGSKVKGEECDDTASRGNLMVVSSPNGFVASFTPPLMRLRLNESQTWFAGFTALPEASVVEGGGRRRRLQTTDTVQTHNVDVSSVSFVQSMLSYVDPNPDPNIFFEDGAYDMMYISGTSLCKTMFSRFRSYIADIRSGRTSANAPCELYDEPIWRGSRACILRKTSTCYRNRASLYQCSERDVSVNKDTVSSCIQRRRRRLQSITEEGDREQLRRLSAAQDDDEMLFKPVVTVSSDNDRANTVVRLNVMFERGGYAIRTKNKCPGGLDGNVSRSVEVRGSNADVSALDAGSMDCISTPENCVEYQPVAPALTDASGVLFPSLYGETNDDGSSLDFAVGLEHQGECMPGGSVADTLYVSNVAVVDEAPRTLDGNRNRSRASMGRKGGYEEGLDIDVVSPIFNCGMMNRTIVTNIEDSNLNMSSLVSAEIVFEGVGGARLAEGDVSVSLDTNGNGFCATVSGLVATDENGTPLTAADKYALPRYTSSVVRTDRPGAEAVEFTVWVLPGCPQIACYTFNPENDGNVDLDTFSTGDDVNCQTLTHAPTRLPTKTPSNVPTSMPTELPTTKPTEAPTSTPSTSAPTTTPTKTPTEHYCYERKYVHSCSGIPAAINTRNEGDAIAYLPDTTAECEDMCMASSQCIGFEYVFDPYSGSNGPNSVGGGTCYFYSEINSLAEMSGHDCFVKGKSSECGTWAPSRMPTNTPTAAPTMNTCGIDCPVGLELLRVEPGRSNGCPRCTKKCAVGEVESATKLVSVNDMKCQHPPTIGSGLIEECTGEAECKEKCQSDAHCFGVAMSSGYSGCTGYLYDTTALNYCDPDRNLDQGYVWFAKTSVCQ